MSDSLLRTPLHALHLDLGAKLVEFAGYAMPVQYPLGIKSEHLHTRSQAGLFDVSHMGQVRISGDTAAQDFEALTPTDIVNIAPMTQRYAVFTNDEGGILDDLMVSNAGDSLFVVVNAGCKAQDLALMQAALPRCEVELIEDRALLALQGPLAVDVLARFAPDCLAMRFMDWQALDVDGIACFAGRAGYTGEDGFEISVPAEQADALARAILTQPEVQAIGLGARDSLRLEAGLCLYGHDLDPTTSPVEASIAWAIQRSRRPGGERAGGYPGAQHIETQLAQGSARRRVGLLPDGRAPVREGADIHNEAGEHVGVVTSGGFGPSLNAPVAMGYVHSDYCALGNRLYALVRGRQIPMTVSKTPFVPQRYVR